MIRSRVIHVGERAGILRSVASSGGSMHLWAASLNLRLVLWVKVQKGGSVKTAV